MTPKEKAVELVNKYLTADYTDINHEGLKCCAIIAVDEILKLYKENWNIENSYWEEVKTEIEKLWLD